MTPQCHLTASASGCLTENRDNDVPLVADRLGPSRLHQLPESILLLRLLRLSNVSVLNFRF